MYVFDPWPESDYFSFMFTVQVFQALSEGQNLSVTHVWTMLKTVGFFKVYMLEIFQHVKHWLEKVL